MDFLNLLPLCHTLFKMLSRTIEPRFAKYLLSVTLFRCQMLCTKESRFAKYLLFVLLNKSCYLF